MDNQQPLSDARVSDEEGIEMATTAKTTGVQPHTSGVLGKNTGRVRSGLRALTQSRSATVGLVIVAMVILVAVFASFIAPHDPIRNNLREINQAPTLSHPLGTDAFGRDILSRLLYGARLSLFLGIGSVLIGATVGITTGLVTGYVGGWVDAIVMRFVDILLTFRLLLLSILIMAILGPSLTNVMIAIGVSLFATFTRLARGEVLSIKSRDYIEAAKAVGTGTSRLLFRHILPNIMGTMIIFATLRLGAAILAEASLSFLGLGSSPPTPTWGLMIQEGLSQIRSAWWISTILGIVITLVVLGFNLLGDGLRDVLDPRLNRSR
jgi:peptide/nickel transport system permease protein